MLVSCSLLTKFQLQGLSGRPSCWQHRAEQEGNCRGVPGRALPTPLTRAECGQSFLCPRSCSCSRLLPLLLPAGVWLLMELGLGDQGLGERGGSGFGLKGP